MAAPARPPTPSQKPLVLIVDDEPEILLTLEATFRRAMPDVEIVTALGSAPALRVLEERPVDLILSDHRMPGITGIDLLALARRLRPDAVGVMMTGHPELEVAVRGVNERLLARLLTKPFKAREVVATVSALLEERQAARMREQAFSRSFDLAARRADGPHGAP